MIDSMAILELLKLIDDAVDGDEKISDDVPHAVENGMKLLKVCVCGGHVCYLFLDILMSHFLRTYSCYLLI